MIEFLKSSRGNGIVMALIGAVLGGIALTSMLSGMKSATKGTRNLASRSDIEILKQTIATYIDCDRTLLNGGATSVLSINPGANCSSTSATEADQKTPFFRIARKSIDGSAQWITPKLDTDNSAVIGNWKVRTSCSSAEQTLVIRAIPDDKKADWDDNVSKLVFGSGGGAFPICFNKAPLQGLSWHNSKCRWDVTGDNFVAPLDSLIIINLLNSAGAHVLVPDTNADNKGGAHPLPGPGNYVDVDNDKKVDQADANAVIDYLNDVGSGACAPARQDAMLSWHKAACRWDINNDGNINNTDQTTIDGILATNGGHDLDPDTTADHVGGIHPTNQFPDVNNDGRVDVIDQAQVAGRLLNPGAGACP